MRELVLSSFLHCQKLKFSINNVGKILVRRTVEGIFYVEYLNEEF
jgi:hypothetical protein